MNLYYRRILIGVFTWLICLSGLTVHAQKQPVIAAPPLLGDSVKTGKTLTVQDTVYFNLSLRPNIAQTKSVDNIVGLYINEFTNKIFPDTFHVTVRIQSDYVLANNSTGSRLDTLHIFYSKNYPYNGKAIKFFKDYYSLQVNVLGVDIAGAADQAVRPLLVLENMMVIERYFITNCNAITAVSKSDTSVSTSGELSVSWPGIAFIPAYDLEWTYIDKTALDAGNYNTNGQLDPQLIFKNNSTRISLAANSYRIPLLYDGEGTLYFRVRTVQYASNGEVTAGLWSTDAGAGGLGSYVFTGHERKLNWYSMTSYAEEGKSKSVVQYVSGDLKNRQTVTKDNTTGTTVVAESFYDKQGREALQVLTTPTLNKLIAYTPLLNVRSINSAEYDQSLYDTLLNVNDFCATAADSMSVANGASRYYSPSNQLSGSGYHQYIPDAKGYVFAETRYTRDNTGRVDRQGSVGADFRIGSGHEAKYFYGSAEQNELDALFGTEAGDASHYQKNLVRDGNGQYGVTYFDMHGRIVATALAGDSTSGMYRLPGYNSVTQTDKLLTPVNNIIKDNTIQSAKSILVPKTGTYSFHYSLSPESLSLADCSNSTICYDCLYDLTITVNDNCSNQQFGGAPKVITLRNFQLFKADNVTHNLDTTCMVANVIDTSFNLLLQEGNYDITKVLSLSKEGMQYYRDSLYLPHNTCKSFTQFVLEQLDSIRNHLDCTPDSLTTNLAVAYREQMIADLTPMSGQYADTAVSRTCFSIFTKNGAGNYFYQTVSGYKDSEGNNDLGSHYNGTDYVMVPPQQLTPAEFIEQFKDSWGATLLSLHPEYRLLLEYEKLKSAYTWEAEFTNTETYAAAVAKGFLNPTGSTNQPATRFTVAGKTDSLFIALGISDPGILTSARQSINNSIFNYVRKESPLFPVTYYTLWGLATGTVKCNTSQTTCFTFWTQNANVFRTDSLCAADLDMAWRIFRSQYLKIREDWIDNYTRTKAGIFSSQFTSSCVAVFPDRNFQTSSAGQEYGNYSGAVQDTTTAQNNFNAYLLANCRAYATKWWQDLAPCGYTQADSAAIISRLIQVAYEGADKNHPFGSSTVRPSSTNPDRSFEQVINEYNAVHYPGMNPVTCNAYLIPNPKPFNKPGMIVNLPIIARPDSCTCSRINGLYLQFITDSSFYHTFSNYLLQAHGTRISQGTLDTLRNLCTVNSTCKYLTKPILLPPVFQCAIAVDACADCSEVRANYDSFTVKFPGAVPTKLEPDSAARHINQIFANYMNHHLGFAKQAYQYLEFLETCPTQGSSNCDSTRWIVFNPGTNLEINADLYTNAVNNIPPYSQHFANGYFIGPPVSKGTHYVLVNKKDTLNVGSNTFIMQWRAKPGTNSNMIDPFIRRGNNTTYVGAEWIRDPADTSWWIGATILRGEDGINIAGMGLQSNSHGLLADWVKIINPSTGDMLYFHDFTFSGNCNSPTGPFLCGQLAQDSSIVLNMNECSDSSVLAVQGATYLFDIYRQKLKGEFEKQYSRKCLDAGKLESFTVTHPLAEYQYTLYYYDQSGHLVKTVPPEGVHHIRRATWLDSVTVARTQGQSLVPSHTLATTYRYNSIKMLVSQHNPDAGLSRFWYDRMGRLVVSQNAKQAAEGNYSYILYDVLGRITEGGQKKQVTPMTDAIARNVQSLDAWLGYTYVMNSTTVIAEQVVSTVYDVQDALLQASVTNLNYIINERFQKTYTLRNRISYARFYDKLKWNGGAKVVSDYDNSITYSYDIHGNIDTLVHDYKTGIMEQHGINRFKAMANKYDQVSGKVKEVHYQPGMTDQFYQRYEYDATNRLTDAYTSDRKLLLGIPVLEEHEARYNYYKHGPLARVVLGQQQVQGMDYAYTLQGWLKGVNSDSLLDEDGKTGSMVAKDAYRFSLNYFNGDYAAIGAAVQAGPGVFPTHIANMGANSSDYRPLYNGNISSMVVGIPKLGETRLFVYAYDQLNRLLQMDSWKGYNAVARNWVGLQKTDEYKERISYDANGNIKTYLRNGHAARLAMDSLTYGYNKDAGDNLVNNRLRHVKDNVPASDYEDLDSQPDDNYVYDAIGNLVKDTKEGIDSIQWTVYGKISKISKTGNTSISYTYDVTGNRISKVVDKNGTITTTWYVRDGLGNAMAVYSGAGSNLTLSEQPVYGSSRIGVWNRNVNMDALPDVTNYSFERGRKFYELSNHLGNVLAAVSDKKIGHDAGNGTTDYFVADVITATDYAPFGMQLAGRTFRSGTLYRYGFNGKENDNEIKGEGNQQDYGMRIYDPRIGKFLSVDPLSGQYPFYTPYQFAGNKPIWAVDMDGLEPKETSTKDKPKDLEGVVVTASNKKHKAIQVIAERSEKLWPYGFKWGGDISNEYFTRQLTERVREPYEMDQGHASGPGGGTNFCWIAAACSYQYQRNPSGMAKIMMDLYSTGKAKVGSIDLHIEGDVRKAIGSNTFDNDGSLAGCVVDQLLFMSIANSYKVYFNQFNVEYDPEDEDATWAAGTFNKFEGLMKAFGSNVVTAHGWDVRRSNVLGSGCNVLLKAQDAGEKIFLYVYSADFKEPPAEHDNPRNIGGSTLPSHFVQVRNVKQVGNMLTMDYWDYGGWKENHQISISALQKCTFGILTTKD